ncbi:MAG: LPS-assembly protein LptD, partial [Meiothermus sp.]
MIFLITLLCSFAHAATLKILEADRLELRNENGEELIILTGTPVKLDRDGELIEAPRVIYNRSQKRLMLSGGVRYKDKQGQVIQADDLDLDTSNESFEAISVKIESGDFYLSGPICERAAGQILLQKGYLTPCQKCAQNTPDYAFQAEEVVLYPGDRIIARGVWVLLRGERTLYLPALLLYLSERRPRLDIGSNSTDGAYIFADLPYVSDFGLGYTFLRYFENRGWGLGFDHFGVGAAKERYQLMYLPAIPSTAGANTATSDGVWIYNLQYKLETGNWRYEGSIRRDDLAGTSNALGDPFGSFGGQADYTEFKLEAATQTNVPGLPEPYYRVTLDGYIDHNSSLGRTPRSTPQRLPEVEVSFPRGYQTNLFSINGSVQVGFYEGPSNPFNRTARNTPYLAAGRLQLVHNETWNPLPPWGGFSFSLTNNFKGIYYTTRNSVGELERLISWQTTAAASQTLGPVKFRLNFRRNDIEGGTPFAFDFPGRTVRDTKLSGTFDYNPDPTFSFSATATRDLEARIFDPPATFTVTARPAPWFSLVNKVSRDIQLGKWGLLTTNLDLTPQPFNFNLSYTRNLELGLSGTLSTRIGY